MFSRTIQFIPRVFALGIGLCIGSPLIKFNVLRTEGKYERSADEIHQYKTQLLKKCVVDNISIVNNAECMPVIDLVGAMHALEECKKRSSNSSDDNCFEKFIYNMAIDRVKYSKNGDLLNKQLLLLCGTATIDREFDKHLSKKTFFGSNEENLLSTKVITQINKEISTMKKCLVVNGQEDNFCVEKTIYSISNIRLQNPQYYRQIMGIIISIIENVAPDKEITNSHTYNQSKDIHERSKGNFV
jgi:hypothetical protein